MTSRRPFFSVIVPTYLRPAELPGCLDALARQQFPIDSFEVIVVDDGSSSPPCGTVREFQIEGKAVALANVGGTIYAINNSCLHRGGPLGQGLLEGKALTCPWHGWQYDVTNGKVVQNPAAGVDCYTTEVRGEDVFVDVGV